MKIRYALLATAVALLSGAGLAQAATTDLGMLSTTVDPTGTVTQIAGHAGTFNNTITGTLPPDSMITLTYTLTGFSAGALQDKGSYNFQHLGERYIGTSTSSSPGTTVSSNTKNPVGQPNHTSASPFFVLASANLAANNESAIAIITNDSIGTPQFFTSLTGHLKNGGKILVNWTVSALSAVPLPSSASLFGLGLALFAGIGMMKRRQTQA